MVGQRAMTTTRSVCCTTWRLTDPSRSPRKLPKPLLTTTTRSAYRSAASKRWEPVEIEEWRGSDEADEGQEQQEYDADHWLVKEELMPEGTVKLILKEKASGRIVQRLTPTA